MAEAGEANSRLVEFKLYLLALISPTTTLQILRLICGKLIGILVTPLTPPAEGSTTPPPLPGHPPLARMATVGQPPVAGTDNGKPFDIVQTYKDLLASDPDLTMPVAAIEALVHLLTASPSTTISETLDQLATSSAQLRRSIPNPISLSAGTDLFQRYLIQTLQRPGQLGPAGDFNLLRQHLLSNSRLFVKRAKAARDKIASYGREFVGDGSTVLTNGGSRVVSALLQRAANEQRGRQSNIRFRVMYVLPSSPSQSTEGLETVQALRQKGVPVATIPESGVAYAIGKADMVIVGAEGVVENGGIISRLGTYQIGLIAKAMKKPFYVVAESYKFVRLYPLGQYDLGIDQKIVDFKTDDGSDQAAEDRDTQEQADVDQTPLVNERKDYFDITNSNQVQGDQQPTTISNQSDAVDFTPPNLISALITESGVLTPSAVSEELIKLWF